MKGKLQNGQRQFLQVICDELRTFIERKVTNMRLPVSVETQVALTLYYLSDEGRLRKTANTFGLSRARVSVIIRKMNNCSFGSKLHQTSNDRERGKYKLKKA